MPYRYRPKDNRTPVLHPVYGHLTYDGVYNDDRMAKEPDFEAIDPGILKRSDLNALALGHGVTDPHLLPSKQAVLDALQGTAPTDPDPGEPDPTADAAATDEPEAHDDADGPAGVEQ